MFWKRKNNNFTPSDFSVTVKISGKPYKLAIGDLVSFQKSQTAIAAISEMQSKMSAGTPVEDLDNLKKQIIDCVDTILGKRGATVEILGKKADNLFNCYELIAFIAGQLTMARVELFNKQAARYARK